MDQFVNEEIYRLLNILLQVCLWSLIVSAPLIIITIEMYAYERYKKWKYKEDKELERIIIGKTNNKEDLQAEIKQLEEDKRRIALDVELLEIRKEALNPDGEIMMRHQTTGPIEELDDPEDETAEEIDLGKMNMKQLHVLARKHNLKWYSRMKKKELINALAPLVQ